MDLKMYFTNRYFYTSIKGINLLVPAGIWTRIFPTHLRVEFSFCGLA